MNTQIKFTYKDVPYTLEYNRDAIKRMEASGFSVQDFVAKPMINIEIAFKGLFLKNHRKTSEKLMDEIYSLLKDKQKLADTMVTMIGECYNSLLDDSDDEGNIEWDIVDLTPTK